jgi:hypothetical protein
MNHLKFIIPAMALMMSGMINVSYAADHAPYMFYYVKNTGNLSQSGCLARAKTAMKRSKVNGMTIGRTFVFGRRGKEKATIICTVAKQREAVIIAVGNDRAKTAALRTTLKKNFRK